MQRFYFKKGLTFIEGDKKWILNRRLANGRLQFEEESTGLVNALSEQEVYGKWLTKTWLIDESNLGEMTDVIYLTSPRDLSTFPEKWQKEARRRLRYIQAINPESIKYCKEVWDEIILNLAIELKDEKPPAASTVHAWWRRFRLSKNVTSLIPNASRRQTDSPNFKRRYAIFESVVERLYLNRQQLPIADVVEEVRWAINKANETLSPHDQIKPIARATIYRWVKDLRQDIVDASRLGPEAARRKYRSVFGGLQVHGILERIEIDHTPIDVIVIDKATGLPLGRPWLTKALCRGSRLIMGFYISFGTPNAYAVLQCLKRSILPKDLMLEKIPEIQGSWPGHGIPMLVAVDNAMELHSEPVIMACEELGIMCVFCPAGDPTTKGGIERYLRTISSGLFHKIPGTVFSNIDERGDYPSENMAVIDLDTLTRLITIWIVDVYNIHYHRSIETSPYLKWMSQADKAIINLPSSPDALDIILGIPATRTLFHYGIELDGMHYNSPALQEIRRIAGKSITVQLKFYEDSVSYIHVFDPFNKEYLHVQAVQELDENLPRHTYRLIRSYARKTFGDQFSIDQLREAKETIRTIIAQALRDKKMGNRKKAAKLLGNDSEAFFRQKSPSFSTDPKIRESKVKPPEDLPEGLHDNLPAVSPIDPTSHPLNDGSVRKPKP